MFNENNGEEGFIPETGFFEDGLQSSQVTIARPALCNGIGIHSGVVVNMTIHPAPAGTGIIFERLDEKLKNPFVPAHYNLVTETLLGTSITNNEGVKVATIEHLMAALWGTGVDNAIISLDGPEVPIMDGSSAPFIDIILKAGLAHQHAKRRRLVVLQEITVNEGDAFACLAPDPDFIIDLEIDFSNNVIGRQKAEYNFSRNQFSETVSQARTFGLEHEVATLRSMGFAKGGSLENAIVVSEEGILNEGGLRYHNEFVRHKILDCVGDLYLAGARISGRFSGYKSGHSLNNKLLRALFANPAAYILLDSTSQMALPNDDPQKFAQHLSQQFSQQFAQKSAQKFAVNAV
jgi:UDP-3-O-[3-hydroxymyristoyl] N-acetylglucosamine deacetylase